MGCTLVSFQSINDTIDTTTSSGKFQFHLICALAEFERNIIRERTMAGLAAARARGKVGGRPKSLNSDQIQLLQKLYANKDMSINQICDLLKISKSTLYTYLHSNKP